MAKSDVKNKDGMIGGVLVLALGVLFLIQNTLGVDISWGKWWPLLLIVFGLVMILKRFNDK